jgi:hypothetical protein
MRSSSRFVLTSRFAFVVRLEMLLHVVGVGELLLTARVGTCNSLFCHVNFGVARSVAGSGEGLVTPMSCSKSARVPLGSLL